MEYFKRYREWLEFPAMDEELKKELLMIKGDEKEIAARFFGELKFGTGGIRGKMGAGTSRINRYIVRKVTEGLARFMTKRSPQKQQLSAVIAYDTRHNSSLFARETASVLVRWKIKVYLFTEPVPTPLLSFAVRELGATAGIVITASHNPPSDNGYKVYWSDGGQITDALASAITAEIDTVKDELAIETGDLEKAESEGLLVMLKEEIIARYLECLQRLRLAEIQEENVKLPLKVVYTPLHGTGAALVPRALKRAGIMDLLVVPEQQDPDPFCRTVRSPNPEDWDVFKLAIDLGRKIGADLLLATDLDADRLGVAVKDSKGDYTPLTGNQLGGLLLAYILSRKKEQGELSSDGLVLKTVVTSELGRDIALSYGLEIVETLTGFKYIGEKIKEMVDNGRKEFIFGYEESYGYLAGDFVRDKDAVQACQLTAEMAAFYKAKGLTLLEALDALFQKYGYFAEELINLELADTESKRLEKMMQFFRQGAFKEIGGWKVVRLIDYLTKESFDLLKGQKAPTGLPSSNSLKYILEGGCWFCVRPSGTEPKMKIYLGVKGRSKEEASSRMFSLKEAVLELVKKAESL